MNPEPHQERAVMPATDCPTAQPQAIKGCLSCLYLCTHENCRNCLSDAGRTDLGGGQIEYRYNYANWKAGTLEEARARRHALEVTGRRSIVIGHEGEAEVIATQGAHTAYLHLCRVAEQCGYFITAPARVGNEIVITCSLSHGVFALIWHENRLAEIVRLDREGKQIGVSWSSAKHRSSVG